MRCGTGRSEPGHVGQVRRPCRPLAVPSATTTRIVSSPATVPRTPGRPGPVERRGHHVGGAGRRAQHDEVGRAWATSTTQSPTTRRRWSTGSALLARQLGDGVDGLAAGHPHLDGAEVLEVARHGGLGGRHALGRQQVDELALAGDGVLGEQAARSGAGAGSCRGCGAGCAVGAAAVGRGRRSLHRSSVGLLDQPRQQAPHAVQAVVGLGEHRRSADRRPRSPPPPRPGGPAGSA